MASISHLWGVLSAHIFLCVALAERYLPPDQCNQLIISSWTSSQRLHGYLNLQLFDFDSAGVRVALREGSNPKTKRLHFVDCHLENEQDTSLCVFSLPFASWKGNAFREVDFVLLARSGQQFECNDIHLHSLSSGRKKRNVEEAENEETTGKPVREEAAEDPTETDSATKAPSANKAERNSKAEVDDMNTAIPSQTKTSTPFQSTTTKSTKTLAIKITVTTKTPIQSTPSESTTTKPTKTLAIKPTVTTKTPIQSTPSESTTTKSTKTPAIKPTVTKKIKSAIQTKPKVQTTMKTTKMSTASTTPQSTTKQFKAIKTTTTTSLTTQGVRIGKLNLDGKKPIDKKLDQQVTRKAQAAATINASSTSVDSTFDHEYGDANNEESSLFDYNNDTLNNTGGLPMIARSANPLSVLLTAAMVSLLLNFVC